MINKIIALIMCFDKHNLHNNILELIYNAMIYLSVQNKTFLTGFPNNLTISKLNNILCNGKYNHNWKMRLLFVNYSHYSNYCNFKGKEPEPCVNHNGTYRIVPIDNITNYNIEIKIIDISTINLCISYIIKNDIFYNKSYWVSSTIIKSGTKVSNTIVIRQDCKNCCI